MNGECPNGDCDSGWKPNTCSQSIFKLFLQMELDFIVNKHNFECTWIWTQTFLKWTNNQSSDCLRDICYIYWCILTADYKKTDKVNIPY